MSKLVCNDRISGRASVKDFFDLTGRGLVLAFFPDLAGTIPRDGSLVLGDITYRYSGPEYVDGKDGSFIGVIVHDAKTMEAFKIGCEVLFLQDS